MKITQTQPFWSKTYLRNRKSTIKSKIQSTKNKLITKVNNFKTRRLWTLLGKSRRYSLPSLNNHQMKTTSWSGIKNSLFFISVKLLIWPQLISKFLFGKMAWKVRNYRNRRVCFWEESFSYFSPNCWMKEK